MMLRSVLGDYLDSLTERELDLPFLLLLPAMGFYDVHLTHGTVEFGKDFIAKRCEDGVELQYSFQSKVGDIRQSDWRNEIQGQILESILSSLSHPNFDPSLPHQAVLVTTGDFKGNAALGLQDLNRKIREVYLKRPITFWGQDNLISFLIDYGLSGMLQATATGFEQHGSFLLIYARSLQGIVSDREIERYSRRWCEQAPESDQWLLRCAIEAEVICHQCIAHERLYEAIHTQLALLRVFCTACYSADVTDIDSAYQQTSARIHRLCSTYLSLVRKEWGGHRDLLSLGPLNMTSYLVHCARTMEVTSLAYFTSETEELRTEASVFLEEFIRNESGCPHPLSDRYAVSVILAVLTLCDAGREEVVRDLLRKVTIWLCDRYEQGMGLGAIDADEEEETRTLLGYAFDFVELPRPGGSFLATALGDLAAFVGDRELYTDIINDIKACEIHMEYWQSRDSIGACDIQAEDVIHYPSIDFDDDPTEFSRYPYAGHLQEELSNFRFADVFGPPAALMLMTLLRDRYFPKLWPCLQSTC